MIEIKTKLDVRRPEPGIYEGISFKRYCRIEAVNQSTLKEILKSPRHYKAAIDKGETDTPAMRDGRIIHSLVLEPRSVSSRVAVWPNDTRAGLVWEAVNWIWSGDMDTGETEDDRNSLRDWRIRSRFSVFDGEARRGKEWKAFKAAHDANEDKDGYKILTQPEFDTVNEFIAANDSGRTPFETRELVTQPEWDRLKTIADAMRDHPLSGPLKIRKSDKGNAWRELTLVWVESTDAGDVLCKARLDLVRLPGSATDLARQVKADLAAESGINLSLAMVHDVKKTATEDEHGFARAVSAYGYDFQREWYCRGWDKLTGQWLPRGNFRFATVGASAPHDVNDYALPEIALHAGKYLVDLALERLTECRVDDYWPGEHEDQPRELKGYRPWLPQGVEIMDLVQMGEMPIAAGEAEAEAAAA